MDNDEPQMDCHTALSIVGAYHLMDQMGIEIPVGLATDYLAAVEHLMSESIIEPYVCSHGKPKIRWTKEFLDIQR
jgi:hypothetical protein